MFKVSCVAFMFDNNIEQELAAELWPRALQDREELRSILLQKWNESPRIPLKEQKMWLIHFESFLTTKVKTTTVT